MLEASSREEYREGLDLASPDYEFIQTFLLALVHLETDRDLGVAWLVARWLPLKLILCYDGVYHMSLSTYMLLLSSKHNMS